jgi:hypothetical protein
MEHRAQDFATEVNATDVSCKCDTGYRFSNTFKRCRDINEW